MDGQELHIPVQIVMPQTFAPLPVPLSPTRSIDLNDVALVEMITYDKLDKAGKPTGEQYEAPAIYRRGISEPMELTAEEYEVFKHYWNGLLENSAYIVGLMLQFLPQQPQPEQTGDVKQLNA